MLRFIGYSLCAYFAFAWQATLRPILDWNGLSPNFLAMMLIVSCVVLSDVSALMGAAVLGLLADSLAQRGLGPDVLSYVALCIMLQVICPPKLVRSPFVLLAIVCGSTATVEILSVILRTTWNHELSWNSPQFPEMMLRWISIATGDGIYTMLLVIGPILVARGLNTKLLNDPQDGFANRWHRLTCH